MKCGMDGYGEEQGVETGYLPPYKKADDGDEWKKTDKRRIFEIEKR